MENELDERLFKNPEKLLLFLMELCIAMNHCLKIGEWLFLFFLRCLFSLFKLLSYLLQLTIYRLLVVEQVLLIEIWVVLLLILSQQLTNLLL